MEMIEKLWNIQFMDISLGKIKDGIIATVYCLGIIKSDGSIRYPHPDAENEQLWQNSPRIF